MGTYELAVSEVMGSIRLCSSGKMGACVYVLVRT